MFAKIKNLITSCIEKFNDFTIGEVYKLQTYEVHYLVDCGAGYMGGVDSLVAVSLDDALSKFKKHDIEKVFCDGKLVYKVSWADL